MGVDGATADGSLDGAGSSELPSSDVPPSPEADGRSDAASPDAALTSNWALACDGVDDRVTIELKAPRSITNATVEFWFYADRVLPAPAGSDEFLFHLKRSPDAQTALQVAIDDFVQRSTRKLAWTLHAQEEGTCDKGFGAPWLEDVPVGRWFHIALVIEDVGAGGPVTQAFVDGKHTGPWGPWPDGASVCPEPIHEIVLCQGPYGWQGAFVGAIDGLRISATSRYSPGADFEPRRSHALDGDTILQLDFEKMPLEALPAAAARLTTSGDPRLRAVPPS